ncbi:MAG: ABC transporter permease [Bacteroidia bacterium]
MRTLRFLLQKEFRQIFRNKALLPMMFVAPVIQLLILPQAANYTIRNINISVVDLDHSSYSRKLSEKILASGYFRSAGSPASTAGAYKLIEEDKADIVLTIPNGFEDNLIREGNQKVAVAVNAINGVKAGVGNNYLGNILQDFNSQIRAEWVQPARINGQPVIEIVPAFWYNPLLTYYIFMVPGILVFLVTLVASNMSALNIVREKEVGTIEQINVTPVSKSMFILGKLIPFWIIGNIIFTVGLLIARFVYGIIPMGSIPLLYGFLGVYLFALLGFGLLISTYSETQQQANSLMFLFVMIFNLMGGLFTPIESMPGWAQVITKVIPISYFIEVMRMIVLKGSELRHILYHVGVVFGMGVILNGWAIWNYRKTS